MAISEHRITRRVQFHETDAAGLVHFSKFFNYMEEAEHALWRAAGLSIHPAGTEVGFPRRATAFEFYRAMRFEEEFDVHIRIVALGPSSIRYRCVLMRGEDLIARGELSIGCVSKRPNEPMKTIPIPDEIAKRFKAAPEGEA